MEILVPNQPLNQAQTGVKGFQKNKVIGSI